MGFANLILVIAGREGGQGATASLAFDVFPCCWQVEQSCVAVSGAAMSCLFVCLASIVAIVVATQWER